MIARHDGEKRAYNQIHKQYLTVLEHLAAAAQECAPDAVIKRRIVEYIKMCNRSMSRTNAMCDRGHEDTEQCLRFLELTIARNQRRLKKCLATCDSEHGAEAG